MEKPSIVSQLLKATVLVALVIVMLFPFVYVTAVSFSSSRDVLRGGLILFPQHPTLESYREILRGGIVQHSLMVSVGITLVGTAADMVMTVALAYGLSRTRDVPGSKFVLYLVLGSMLFGAGIIPNYLLVKSLHLLNTYASLIVPGLIAGFNLVWRHPRPLLPQLQPDQYAAGHLCSAGRLPGHHRVCHRQRAQGLS
jgi:putative aldouronate transport system permease protein